MTTTSDRVTTKPLPPEAHTRQPWRIHAIAPDFRLEDVWELPMRGGPDDFPSVVAWTMSLDEHDEPLAVRLLMALRFRIGGLLGLDSERAGVGGRVVSLSRRLPADLDGGPTGPDVPGKPLRAVYLTRTEWVAEIANRTCHGLLHVGWVQVAGDEWRGQLAVLVKPNGWFGRAYLAAIRPVRYLVVYPAMLRNLQRRWEARTDTP